MKINGEFKHLVEQVELLALKDSLIKRLPLSGMILNVLNLEIEKKFSQATQVDFYLYEENNNRESGLKDPFLICIQQANIHSLYGTLIFPPRNTTPQMMDDFENFMNWDKAHIFGGINQHFFANHLRPVLLKRGAIHKPDGTPCESYALSSDIALQCPDLSVPEEKVEVKELSVSDSAEIIRNYHEWAQPHSQFQIEEAIKNLTSGGVFVDSVLASSALLSPVGLINILYTDTPHRRKGYGVMVLRHLGKSVANLGLIPTAECEIWNDSSRQTILKSGFRFVGHTNWIRFKKL